MNELLISMEVLSSLCLVRHFYNALDEDVDSVLIKCFSNVEPGKAGNTLDNIVRIQSDLELEWFTREE